MLVEEVWRRTGPMCKVWFTFMHWKADFLVKKKRIIISVIQLVKLLVRSKNTVDRCSHYGRTFNSISSPSTSRLNLIPSIPLPSLHFPSSSPSGHQRRRNHSRRQLKTGQVLFHDVEINDCGPKESQGREGERERETEGRDTRDKRRTSGWERLKDGVRVCQREGEEGGSRGMLLLNCTPDHSSDSPVSSPPLTLQLQHHGTTLDFNFDITMSVTRGWRLVLK